MFDERFGHVQKYLESRAVDKTMKLQTLADSDRRIPRTFISKVRPINQMTEAKFHFSFETSVSKLRQFSATHFERKYFKGKIICKGFFVRFPFFLSEGRGWCRAGHAIVKRRRT